MQSDYDKLLAEKLQLTEEYAVRLHEENLTNTQAIAKIQETLKNTKIDLSSANDKLTESLSDYKNSITKFKSTTYKYQ